MSKGARYGGVTLVAISLLVACLLLAQPRITVDFTAAVTLERPARI